MRTRPLLRRAAYVLATAAFLLAASDALRGQPQYAALQAHTCQSCHVSPTGGFGRWPHDTSLNFADGRVFLSGDIRFLALYDKRSGRDRSALFPMEGAIHAGVEAAKGLTVAISNDFGTTRELYALYQPRQSFYVRGGWLTLPYGLLVADHTAFIKEGRVEAPAGLSREKGIGAGLFGTRYKDAGLEAGWVGPPFFLSASVTSGLSGQESRPSFSPETDTRKAVTGRSGWMTKHAMIGGSYYNNGVSTFRQTRYGAFGWLAWDPFVLIAEADRGRDETIAPAAPADVTLAAAYAELLWKSPWDRFRGYAKLRYEHLDPDRSLDGDSLRRVQGGYEWFPWKAGSLELFYRRNGETPDADNDDILLMNHLYF